ncbi:hypothetical protein ACHQM5_004624 [Ranunculus cassubicifolius]
MENPNNSKPAIAQFNADANLLAEFQSSEKGKSSFHYSESVKASPEPVAEGIITAYLSNIQRGGRIQSFGCLFALEEPSFRILAYSANLFEFLGLNKASGKSLLGLDARQFFTKSSVTSLEKALTSADLWLSNPAWVVSENTQKSFLAILHRIDVGILIDLEPVKQEDPRFSVDGTVRSQKLALQAIMGLQTLPRGDIELLCDTLVKYIKEICGYDRVMVYKFHEDQHGEVMSEMRRSDLEPYLGSHYPATDVPQAARFLFKRNRVRMICDTNTDPVPIVQCKELEQPIILVNSTLRAPHDCHLQYMANMGSIASLVMSITVNENDSMKLWGLVSCHHLSPRYLPFPVRYACQFIMQAFGSQLTMELQLLLHTAEKKILKTEALLCDMILKDAPLGIMTKYPNIMDLVSCNGAAFYYGGVCRILGATPTEQQIESLTKWLLAQESELTVWSTDSLVAVGYPNADTLGGDVCGMVVAKITSKDFLFWFRSKTEKEVRWGGAKHHYYDKDDDGKIMHPRTSFKVFLEVVKHKSYPWEAWELNAVQSLQSSMLDWGSFQDIEKDSAQMIVAKKNESEIERLTLLANEMVRLLETAIAPIFAVDSSGNITRWNSKIAELTGMPTNEAIGKSMLDEFVHETSRVDFGHHLSRAFQGEDEKNIEVRLKTFQEKNRNDYVCIVANACSCKGYTNSVINICFIGQDVTGTEIATDKFLCLQEDYKAMSQILNPTIPPIFVSDEHAKCSEWNDSMEKLTGWNKSEVIGILLPGEIFGEYCRLTGQDAVTKLMILLYQTLCSQGNGNFPFSFFTREGAYVETILTTNKRIDVSGNVTGCVCSLKRVLPNTKHDSYGRRRTCIPRFEDLEYIRQEMECPLNGIQFIRKLLENSDMSNYQKQILETIEACEMQIRVILQDTSLRSINDGCLELKTIDFRLKNVMDAVVSQVMALLIEKNIHLIQELSEDIEALTLCGDQFRFQQILSSFLVHIVHHTPTPNGCVEIRMYSSSKSIHGRSDHVQLQIRMIHSGQGLPLEFVEDMFHGDAQWTTKEGFRLRMARKLLRKMNADVQYIRESNKCYFLIDMEFQTLDKRNKE